MSSTAQLDCTASNHNFHKCNSFHSKFVVMWPRSRAIVGDGGWGGLESSTNPLHRDVIILVLFYRNNYDSIMFSANNCVVTEYFIASPSSSSLYTSHFVSFSHFFSPLFSVPLNWLDCLIFINLLHVVEFAFLILGDGNSKLNNQETIEKSIFPSIFFLNFYVVFKRIIKMKNRLWH